MEQESEEFEEQNEDNGTPRRGRVRTVIIVMVIIVLSICLGAGAYMIFGRTGAKETDNRTTADDSDENVTGYDANNNDNRESFSYSPRRAMEHVNYLAERIGVRTFGSASEAQAADYIAGQLGEYGYTVEEHEFSTDEGFASENITGTLRGAKEGYTLIIAAHFDSGVNSRGAVDNGSGVAAVLELARILQNKQTKPTVKFIFFGSNMPGMGETGDRLVGARRFLQTIGTFEIDEVIGMIAVDSVAQGDVLGLKTQETGLQRLRAKIETYANKNDVPVTLMKSAADSDNIPFEDAQIPAVWVSWCNPDGSLVTDNLITSVSSDKIQTAAELIESFILDLTLEDLEELKY